MAVPFRFHPILDITVLNYKLVGEGELPNMKIPPANMKYIAIRLVLTNPGRDKGKPPAVFPNVVEKIEIRQPNTKDKNGFKIYTESMSDSLDKYVYGERGMAFADIRPGESHTGWIVGLIPKDANPPYILRITPSNQLKPPANPVEVNLGNF